MNRLLLLLLFIVINLIVGVLSYFVPELNMSNFIIYHIWINVLILFVAIFS